MQNKVLGSLIFKVMMTLVIAPMIFGVIGMYLKYADINHSFELALFITPSIILVLFAGRYTAYLFISKNKSVNSWTYIILGILIIISAFFIIFSSSYLRHHHEVYVVGILCTALFVLTLSVGILIKLIRISIANKLNELESSSVQSQSELQLLQSQLSPHFLFNTLNNLYGLSLTEHQKIPNLILKLSDLLRYSVYEAKEKFVPLLAEMSYLNHYIEFEKIRLGSRLELKQDFEVIPNTHIKIAPMILIVFLENAFKHSKNTSDEKIFISIELGIWGNSILFHIVNTFDPNSSTYSFGENHKGFGLDNVKKRLELLYPKEHDLIIHQDNSFFEVRLRLNIK